ncbi:Protein of unknown function [Pyronema omphalodes CBS 100304]|uniref:Uncharacterized protein n=1 Tax=Pyronema omphalodes (strain CBS 100304) TaxID=1076935 RepID=U4KYY8_PYROM|nr:Protein of unknown function [Pyronema omphalodes CBS 100304]
MMDQGQYRHRFKFEKWLGHLKVWLEFYYYQEQAGEEFLFIGYGLQIQTTFATPKPPLCARNR